MNYIKIDWITIFKQTIDDGYSSLVLKYKPYTVNLGDDLTNLLMKQFANKLLCLLGLNDKYKIEGVDSDLTQSLHVQIMENYGNIQIMFDTDWKI